VRAVEDALVGTQQDGRLTRKVAFSFAKLMAYKDEYEVARLFADDAFKKQLEAQFDGDYRLQFHVAPPLFSYLGRKGRAPRRMRFGPWLMSAMRLLAKARRVRGTWLDLFGKNTERRMERQSIERYESLIAELLPQITRENLELAAEIAALPERIRGFGYVKIASVALARERETELLHRFDPQRYPSPAKAKANQRIGNIPVVLEKVR